jgi:spermidine synthase
VGGLGLGYTAVAALSHPHLRSLLVIEALAPVIDWHQRALVPLGPQLTSDPRCRLIHADFFALASGQGFDPLDPTRLFHAILLDIDHSPRNLLHPRNAPFYQPSGLRALAAQLHPGGIFALWSDDPPDPDFTASLATVFPETNSQVVHFPNPLLSRDSASTIYIARGA